MKYMVYFSQILGHAPYRSFQYVNTQQLGALIMKHMHDSENVEENYMHNLALFVSYHNSFTCNCIINCLNIYMQRNFSRSVSHSEATHKNLRVWLDDAIPSEDMCKIIMEEDKLYDYSSEQDTSNNDVIVTSEISVNPLD